MENKIITNPLKAIKKHCIECCGGIVTEPSLCAATDCPLYPFRKGTNPHRKKRELSEEQKAKQIEILRQARENR